MNAPANIVAKKTDPDAQSLLARCQDKRWRLLQQFASLEIILHRRLDNPPRTFGAKLRAWIKLDPVAKKFERLISARNLLAHAAIHCVQVESVTYALWEIADGTNDLNCAKFDGDGLTEWNNEIGALLDEAMAGATPLH